MANNIEQCIWYKISRDQRKVELKREQGKVGTKNYVVRGCYNCSGYTLECPKYFTLKLKAKNQD